MRQAGRQRVNIAVDAVQPLNLIRYPIGGQATVLIDQIGKDMPDQGGVMVGHHLAKIRNLTNIP